MTLRNLKPSEYDLVLPNGDTFKWSTKYSLKFNANKFYLYLIKSRIKTDERYIYYQLLEDHVNKIYDIN